jgi:hypothetical protein
VGRTLNVNLIVPDDTNTAVNDANAAGVVMITFDAVDAVVPALLDALTMNWYLLFAAAVNE